MNNFFKRLKEEIYQSYHRNGYVPDNLQEMIDNIRDYALLPDEECEELRRILDEIGFDMEVQRKAYLKEKEEITIAQKELNEKRKKLDKKYKIG